MRNYKKRDFPVAKVRRFLEVGPIVLVSSYYKGEHNIMTMGWHTVMEFSPSLVGCMITAANHSFELIKKSKECVINIPTVDMIDTIVGIGNCSGTDVDKFSEFDLTATPATQVSAPMIKECYANFECKVVDTSLLNKYNFFILEVVKAHVATSPRYPRTVHYRGDGIFMVSGEHINKRKLFKPEML
ncbi:flavin reductase family protein [Bdellovibrio sp. NC01]|uniref:flavin reductase family protein n=1 Tax=Bdellovibrio sp. NC01 TaxID=2220073 RepID=UPI0011588C11|nr:flavin reductase family protein [Bdellovibrio sp. NC01]QDK37587.1 flavin reductase family protein [Bdellovibrio sp. NC01]